MSRTVLDILVGVQFAIMAALVRVMWTTVQRVTRIEAFLDVLELHRAEAFVERHGFDTDEGG